DELARDARRGRVETREPRRGAEPDERLARRGGERACLVAAPTRTEPLRVLDLRRREVEREAVRAEQLPGAAVTLVDPVVVAARGAEARAVARALSLEERRQLARANVVDARQEVADAHEVVELERRLERLREAGPDVRAANAQVDAVGEPTLRGGERVLRPPLGAQHARLDRRERGGRLGDLRAALPFLVVEDQAGRRRVATLALDRSCTEDAGAGPRAPLETVRLVDALERLAEATELGEDADRAEPRRREQLAVAALAGLRLDLLLQRERAGVVVGVLEEEREVVRRAPPRRVEPGRGCPRERGVEQDARLDR